MLAVRKDPREKGRQRQWLLRLVDYSSKPAHLLPGDEQSDESEEEDNDAATPEDASDAQVLDALKTDLSDSTN